MTNLVTIKFYYDSNTKSPSFGRMKRDSPEYKSLFRNRENLLPSRAEWKRKIFTGTDSYGTSEIPRRRGDHDHRWRKYGNYDSRRTESSLTLPLTSEYPGSTGSQTRGIPPNDS